VGLHSVGPSKSQTVPRLRQGFLIELFISDHRLNFYLINRTGYSFSFYFSLLKPLPASVFLSGCGWRGVVSRQCVASCGTRPVMRSKINYRSQVDSLAA
jgi:hypothetical protein